jgi:hypothetical protein
MCNHDKREDYMSRLANTEHASRTVGGGKRFDSPQSGRLYLGKQSMDSRRAPNEWNETEQFIKNDSQSVSALYTEGC